MTLSYPIIYKKVAFPPLQPAKAMVYYKRIVRQAFCPHILPLQGSTKGVL